MAVDVVQDALCRAIEVWPFRGVPDDPSAWLMATAKHRALDVLRRERTARTLAPEVARTLETAEPLYTDDAIKDDQLRMMFSCCHPRLSEAAQVALMLHILCGFSVDEVAGAFVSTHAGVEKRLTRAKHVLARSQRLFEIADPADFAARLPAVQRALYLLFNEGYHGASPQAAVRAELCREARRLTVLRPAHPVAATPAPVVALNRAIALAQRDGPEPGLAAIAAIADRDRLANYPFYHAALGELELRRGQGDAARGHFAAALALARNATERQFLAQRMEACSGEGSAPAPAQTVTL